MKWLVVLSFAALFSPVSHAQSNPDPAVQFVTEVKDRALALYEESVAATDRHEKLCGLVDQVADIQGMADSTLDKRKENVSPEQLAEFYRAFRVMLVQLFDSAFAKLHTGTVTIETASRGTSNGLSVAVTVEPAGNRSPTRFQFFVSPTGPQEELKLKDAAMTGVLLVRAMRSKYQGFMNAIKAGDDNARVAALVHQLNSENPPCP